MLPYVGYFQQIWIHPGIGKCLAEGLFMHARRTGSNDNRGQFMLHDGIPDHPLPGIGAHVFIFNGELYLLDALDLLNNLGNIHIVGNVCTAKTNENSYSCHYLTSLSASTALMGFLTFSGSGATFPILASAPSTGTMCFGNFS